MLLRHLGWYRRERQWLRGWWTSLRNDQLGFFHFLLLPLLFHAGFWFSCLQWKCECLSALWFLDGCLVDLICDITCFLRHQKYKGSSKWEILRAEILRQSESILILTVNKSLTLKDDNYYLHCVVAMVVVPNMVLVSLCSCWCMVILKNGKSLSFI